MSIQNWKFNTTDNGSFFWEAMTKAGETLGRSSQNFKSQNGAKYNADLLGRSGNYSQKLAWEFMQDKENNWLWKADNTVNKENVAAAHKPFKSKIEAVQNAILFGYKGEFVDLVNSNTSSNGVATVVGSVKDSNPNATHINTSSTSKTSSNNISSNFVTTTPKMNTDEYDKKIYSSNVDDDNNSSWWKWLLLALLILGLLWWLLPMLTRKAETPALDVKSNSSLNVNLPNLSGILGTLKSPNFDILKGAITSSGLVDTINKSVPLTMLAPTNAAFQALAPDALINLQKPENKLNLGNILKNHLFSGNLDLNALKDGSSVKSLGGLDLPVKVTDGKLFIGGVEVEKTADETGNGITAYSISKLLPIPENTVAQPAQTITSSVVTESSKSEYKAGSALDTLNSNGNFKTLLAALNAADLKTVLEGDGPFTIFAPNDEALKSVQSTVDDLLKPENKTKLQAFLKNHVALGKNTFEDFKANKIVTTLNDQRVILRTNSAGVGRVEGLKNTAQAPVPDIITNNAVVHTLTDSPLLI
jgi:uncharacterized surface protein with fasciclin (FAS1) repeats